MNIVVASDDNYAIHLLTLLVSIGENNKQTDIDFHILDGGINLDSKNKINEILKIYVNIEVHYYEMTEKKLEEMLGGRIKKDRSLLAYARLFIPKLISGERALYLDVDGIVNSDLDELYNVNLDGKAIGGVLDTNPIERHYNVGLNNDSIYINSGMILFDLNKCRELDFTKLCLDFVEGYNGKVDAMDQGTINGAVSSKNQIEVLNPKFNVFTSLFQLSSSEIKKIYNLSFYYTDNEIEEACKNPVFVHFTPNMTTRPWVEHCKHPLKNEYWKYRKQVDSSIVYENDKRSRKLKFLGFIYRNFPSNVYVFLTNLRGKNLRGKK